MDRLHLNKRLDALVPLKSDAVGQFIEDRVLHAREDAEENAQAERLADPDAYTPSLGTPA